ncbi:uncharacterized protein LOC122528704 [Frieseomelitta varia]|uniref:uncharacterized protein LOC122528704 n=1 Tax=Frieseomelitta varia TaxID=561572 RepID=UPI001CB6AC53|nr:uncharacterized protein LOC122528704 [Frieseomelitta varia]
MIESSEKIQNIYEELDNADRINYLIKQFAELKEKICKQKKDRYYWKSHFSTLLTNIWAGQIKYLELHKKEIDLRNRISEVTNMVKLRQQKLKDLSTKRMVYFTEQCDKYRIKSITFANNFLHAQKKYSNRNLNREIREFREEYQEMYNEMPILAKKLENLETLCDLNKLSSEEAEEISKINLVLSSITKTNTSKLLQLTYVQNTLKKLENEIKQKKTTFSSLQK